MKQVFCTCGKPKQEPPTSARRNAGAGFVAGLLLAAVLSFALSFLLTESTYSASLGLGEITETAKAHFAQNEAIAVFFGIDEDPPVSA